MTCRATVLRTATSHPTGQFGPRPNTVATPREIILVVQHTTCTSCGAAHSIPNKELLFVYEHGTEVGNCAEFSLPGIRRRIEHRHSRAYQCHECFRTHEPSDADRADLRAWEREQHQANLEAIALENGTSKPAKPKASQASPWIDTRSLLRKRSTQ